MKKHIITIAFVLLSQLLFSQIGTGTSTRIGGENSKWTFGGGASFGIAGGNGGSGTTIGISPRVGYKITEDLEGGLSGSLLWGNSKYSSTTVFGVGPFANYYVARNFFISALFQENFFSMKDKVYGGKYSGNEPALYLGGGYMQRIGNGTYLQIGAMYNVLYDENDSIFTGGFVPSIGIVWGL